MKASLNSGDWVTSFAVRSSNWKSLALASAQLECTAQERDEGRGERKQGEPLPVEQGILNQAAETERALAAYNLQSKANKLNCAERKKDHADERACRPGFPVQVQR